MRDTVVSIFYNRNYDDTTIKLSVAFEREHNLTKIDVLNDAIRLLRYKLEEIINIEFLEEEKV
jgi:hypothetical protein